MNRARRRPLAPDHTLGAAIDTAVQEWAQHSLLEDLAPDITTPLIHLRATPAAERPLADLRLIAADLAELTGAPSNRIAARTAEVARTATLCLLAAAILTIAISRQEDPSAILGLLPKPREHRQRECHTDAEILALRCAAVSRGDRGFHTAAARYALVETGAWPTEISGITRAHFDHPATPQTVNLTGVDGHLGQRTRPVPTWAQPLLARAIASATTDGLPDHAPLFYRGTDPRGAAATASVSDSLRELLPRCGWKCVIGKPLNAARWRIALIQDQEGLRSAATAFGVSNDMGRVHTFTRQRPQARIAPAGPRTYIGA